MRDGYKEREVISEFTLVTLQFRTANYVSRVVSTEMILARIRIVRDCNYRSVQRDFQTY